MTYQNRHADFALAISCVVNCKSSVKVAIAQVHALTDRIGVSMRKVHVLFGCHISESKIIFGGSSGNSFRDVSAARSLRCIPQAPSTDRRKDESRLQDSSFVQGVSRSEASSAKCPCISTRKRDSQLLGPEQGYGKGTHPMITICHSRMLSSSTRPAENPSTGFFCRSK